METKSKPIRNGTPARARKKKKRFGKDLLICEKTGQKTKLKKGDTITFKFSSHETIFSLFRPRSHSQLLWPGGAVCRKIKVSLDCEEYKTIALSIANPCGLGVKLYTVSIVDSCSLIFEFV